MTTPYSMRTRFLFSLPLFFGLLTCPAVAQTSPAKIPDDWAVTSIKGKFLRIDSASVRVFLDMTARKPATVPATGPTISAAEFAEHFLINYVVYPDYANRERLAYGNIPLTAQSVTQVGDHLLLQFDLKRPAIADKSLVVSAILLTEVTETNTGKKALNDLPIRFRSTALQDRVVLMDPRTRLPLLRHFAHVGDTLLLAGMAATQPVSLTAVRYRNEFDAASSPMNTTPRPAPRQLTSDSTLTVVTGQPFVLPREGLYYFTDDTAATTGLGIWVGDRRFPKMTRPAKLVKPLLYVSTGTENGELGSAANPKKAFDKYWLTLMGGNEELARQSVKAYFGRVEEANRLFTSYKEGWKTDKGMIYVVLGPPDRIQRGRDREVWVYTRKSSSQEVNFTFNRRPNQFVEDHYELARYEEYQPIWYPVVEAWRTGAVRE
jgi:GWxTD domain-containing protein